MKQSWIQTFFLLASLFTLINGHDNYLLSSNLDPFNFKEGVECYNMLFKHFVAKSHDSDIDESIKICNCKHLLTAILEMIEHEEKYNIGLMKLPRLTNDYDNCNRIVDLTSISLGLGYKEEYIKINLDNLNRASSLSSSIRDMSSFFEYNSKNYSNHDFQHSSWFLMAWKNIEYFSCPGVLEPIGSDVVNKKDIKVALKDLLKIVEQNGNEKIFKCGIPFDSSQVMESVFKFHSELDMTGNICTTPTCHRRRERLELVRNYSVIYDVCLVKSYLPFVDLFEDCEKLLEWIECGMLFHYLQSSGEYVSVALKYMCGNNWFDIVESKQSQTNSDKQSQTNSDKQSQTTLNKDRLKLKLVPERYFTLVGLIDKILRGECITFRLDTLTKILNDVWP